MIDRESINKVITSLKPYTATSIEKCQDGRLPIVYNRRNDKYVSIQHYEEGMDVESGATNDAVLEYNQDTKITNQWMFHYNNKWYINKFSADEPIYNYGILKVEDSIIPWRNLEWRRDKHSFVARMDRLIYQKQIEPFLIFVDHRFVNWNYIDLVFDNDDTYILLHGSQYNYYTLWDADINIVILPYNLQFVGNENNDSFNTYYNMLSGYLQESIHVDDQGNPRINVPTMDGEYEYRGMVYNVGAWLYTQVRNYKLGILSSEREQRMKNIYTYWYRYDAAGNIIETKTLRFNALDNDSYEQPIIDEITSVSYSKLVSWALFRFDDDGLYDRTGANIISKLRQGIVDDEAMGAFTSHVSESILPKRQEVPLIPPIHYTFTEKNLLFFEDGEFSPYFDIERIDNDNKLHYTQYAEDVYGFAFFKYDLPNDTGLKNIRASRDLYYRTDYFKNLPTYEPSVYMENFDYPEFSNDLSYEQNLNNAYNKILEFDNYLLKDLYTSDIKSVSMTGDEANSYMTTHALKYGVKGLPIPRQKYEDHETYVMIFLNGEIIDNYNELVVYPNKFFLPRTSNFASADTIEYTFFTNVDNNEIHFDYSEFIEQYKLDELVDGHYKKIDIFDEYMNAKDLKVFCSYPSRMMKYSPIVDPDESIAFNVSYRGDDGDLYIDTDSFPTDEDEIHCTWEYVDKTHIKVYGIDYITETVDPNVTPPSPYEYINGTEWILLDIDSEIAKIVMNSFPREFVAVSSKKFVYQRAEINHRMYRIKLGEQFRYCDNQKQYELFINGRRMENDSFIVTIPKHSRPFWGMYLYTAKFVAPGDRVDIFYIPQDLNTNAMTEDNTIISFGSPGVVWVDRMNLNVPLWNDMYLFFMNGKKIPTDEMIDINSYMIKIGSNPYSLKHFTIIPIYNDYINEVRNKLRDPVFNTKYDAIIDEIVLSPDGVNKIRQVIGNTISIYEDEPDALVYNVGRIALINEIIRNFWVRSGWDYTKRSVYDFLIETDYFMYDSTFDQYNTSAMDANEYINIIKNYPYLVSFTLNPDTELYEYGRTLPAITVSWEFSENFYDPLEVRWQKINDISVETNRRSYTLRDLPSVDQDIKFIASTGYDTLEAVKHIRFANAIYFGNIDEDLLEDYDPAISHGKLPLDEITAFIPKNGVFQSEEDMRTGSYEFDGEWINNYYYKIDDIGLESQAIVPGNPTIPDGRSATNTVPYTKDDLDTICNQLSKDLSLTVSYTLKHVIGNNNYLVIAIPKRLCYINYKSIVNFIMPDPESDDVKAHCRDDKTTPIYTDGKFNPDGTLHRLRFMSMQYMGEFSHTNAYGFTEDYVMWKTNGFFTRLFDDYEFTIKIVDTTQVEEVNTNE